MLELRCTLGLLLLLPVARAQEAQATPPPILDVTTGTDWIRSASFGLITQVGDEELEEGQGHHVVVGADREVAIDVAELKGDLLRMRARPGPLLEAVLDNEVSGIVLGLLRGTFTMVLFQDGVTAKEADAFFRAILDLPHQVKLLEIRAWEPAPSLTEVIATLEPVPGTWLARACEGLQPNPAGCPVLRGADAALTLELAVDPQGLAELLAPYHTFSVALTSRDAEERAELTATLRQALGHLDGSMALSLDRTGTVRQLIGIRDSARYREFLDGPAHEKLIERRTGGQQLVSVLRMPESLKHRGVELQRSALRFDLARLGADTGLGEVPLLVYAGLVGEYELTAEFDPDVELDGIDRTKALVDRVLDGRIRRFPVPGEALAHVEARVGEVIAVLVETLGLGVAPEDAPEHAILDIRRTGRGLQFHLQMR